MVLHDHHGDVVYLDGVGHRDHWPVRGTDVDRLIVENPVSDVFDTGFGKVVDGFEGLCQAGTFPPAWGFAGNGTNRLDGVPDRRTLILDVMHWHLLPAMTHEFPARVFRG